LSIRIKNKNWSVLKEHAIPTTAGIRRPDLIVYKDNNAAVIDVTVVSDNGKLDDSHKRKVEYYNNNEITNWIKKQDKLYKCGLWSLRCIMAWMPMQILPTFSECPFRTSARILQFN